MFMDQMELAMKTLMPTTMFLESELALQLQELVPIAKSVIGPLFTGLELFQTAELLLTLEPSQAVFQRPSPSVPTKSSPAGTSQFQSSSKELRPDSHAHLTSHMVVLSPGPQLEEIQSHSTLMLPSISKLLSATGLQNSLNTSPSQLPPPCSQIDACGSILKRPTPPSTTWF